MTLGDFTQQADAYGRSRPAYPTELLAQLTADVNVGRDDPVADFGAGTGIMTAMLVERGYRVSAIEPNESMRRQNTVPQARWIDGTFEASGLDAASQKWAIAAQAFHWADPPRSLPELHRVLQPGSFFTILWNNRVPTKDAVVGWTEACVKRHVPEFDEAYRNRPWDQILESTGHFTFFNKRTAEHIVPMSRTRYLELWRSHNRLNTIAGPQRFEMFYRELTDELKTVDNIDVPYRCEAWSARRNDD